MVAGTAYSESLQEYLETIYRISGKKERPDAWITNNEIATALDIKPPSVTEMLNKMEKQGLLEWTKRKGARLTAKGERMGKEVLDMHLLLEEFFTIVLEIDDKDLKHRIACSIEHHLISEPRFVEALRVAIAKIKTTST
ncbi:MAG: metal-dependent transcriptional regulator [Promethearchaeota archaeon]